LAESERSISKRLTAREIGFAKHSGRIKFFVTYCN
jgi:hypothetical protein